MRLGKWALEIGKWVYVLVVASILFLFFCLILDLLSFWIGSGWNPLLGQWPIFSGTVAAIWYSSPVTVVSLMIGVAAIGRLILWDRMPGLLGVLMKHHS